MDKSPFVQSHHEWLVNSVLKNKNNNFSALFGIKRLIETQKTDKSTATKTQICCLICGNSWKNVPESVVFVVNKRFPCITVKCGNAVIIAPTPLMLPGGCMNWLVFVCLNFNMRKSVQPAAGFLSAFALHNKLFIYAKDLPVLS